MGAPKQKRPFFLGEMPKTVKVLNKERNLRRSCAHYLKDDYAQLLRLKKSIEPENIITEKLIADAYTKINHLKNRKFSIDSSHRQKPEPEYLQFFRLQLKTIQKQLNSLKNTIKPEYESPPSSKYKPSKTCPPGLGTIPMAALGRSPNKFINASPSPLQPCMVPSPLLTETHLIDELVECCVTHSFHCPKREIASPKIIPSLKDKSNERFFKNGVIFGEGISRQVLCKQCTQCNAFIFFKTTTKISLSGDDHDQNLLSSKIVFSSMVAGMGYNDINKLFTSVHAQKYVH